MSRTTTDAAVISAGVDWLTCTAPYGSAAVELVERANEIIRLRQGDGFDLWAGHIGDYKAHGTDGIRVGERRDGVIVLLSGEVAHHEWYPFAVAAKNVSRLDAEVTIELPESDLNLAKNAYRQVRRHVRPTGGRPTKPQLVRTLAMREKPEASATCYIGARTSAFFGRIYDKGAESRSAPPGLRWRYEAELKEDAAKRAREDLLAILKETPEGERWQRTATHIRRRVWSEMKDRGVSPRFSARGVIPIQTRREPTDDETWLEWLRESVAPSVHRRRLEGRVSDNRILAALAGLPDPEPTTEAYRTAREKKLESLGLRVA